jgi:hypothetical protein
MNHVHTEEQRNLQAAFFHGYALYLFYFGNRLDIEKSAHFSFLDFLRDARA